MILGAFGIFYTVGVYLTWLPSYLQTSRGLSLSETGWLSSLPYLAESHQVASLGAIQNFGGFLGAAMAPIVTGAILDATGNNYSYVFLVGGVVLLLGGMSCLFFVKDRHA
jgi:cyanate permease